ncbi:MAG: CAP domain-containing protein [Bacteroidia bacterium]
MKKVIVFLFALLASSRMDAQIFQTAQLAEVIKKCYTDSVRKTERLAALKFHNLINDYRQQNKLDTLAWDDTLWLASRNHTIWMGENAKLSHTQTEGTKFFTGNGPGERYRYVKANKGSSAWSGENALYNWSDNGSSIESISDIMAKAAFNQWKNSPGHDENMRAPHSHSHGTAFYLDPDGPVWATDLFSYQKLDKLNFSVSNELASAAQSTPVKGVKTEHSKTEGAKKIRIKEAAQFSDTLLAALENSSKAKRSKSAKKAAQRHADYLACTKKLSHEQRKNKPGFYAATPEKRMMKASLGWYFFQQKKTPVSESIAQLTLTQIPSDIPGFVNQVNAALDSEKLLKGSPLAVGYGVTFKQVKNSLNIYVVRVERVNPESLPASELSSK